MNNATYEKNKIVTFALPEDKKATYAQVVKSANMVLPTNDTRSLVGHNNVTILRKLKELGRKYYNST